MLTACRGLDVVRVVLGVLHAFGVIDRVLAGKIRIFAWCLCTLAAPRSAMLTAMISCIYTQQWPFEDQWSAVLKTHLNVATPSGFPGKVDYRCPERRVPVASVHHGTTLSSNLRARHSPQCTVETTKRRQATHLFVRLRATESKGQRAGSCRTPHPCSYWERELCGLRAAMMNFICDAGRSFGPPIVRGHI